MNVYKPNMIVSVLCLLLLSLGSNSQLQRASSVIVQESGAQEVEKFATVINFYIQVQNTANENVNVTITPDKCCLIIENSDIDCEVMVLKSPITLPLGGLEDEYNNTASAVFLFRNLYTRYRQGNCSFTLQSTDHPSEWSTHSFDFNTYPDEPHNCTGIDQDPDRDCSPVDCAIKYHGNRNFYRNSTGKCEEVVDCDTRGKDGISVVAYYDWETNTCHRLDWLEDNEFSHVESDTEIPAEIDPSQTTYFPDFEPERLKTMAAKGEYKLQCNHGVQNGIYCDCDNGWMSSGVHEDDIENFHWCDAQMLDSSSIQHQPRQLNKAQEVFLVIFLSLGNCMLTVVWFYVSYKVCCKEKFWHLYYAIRGTYRYKALQQSE